MAAGLFNMNPFPILTNIAMGAAFAFVAVVVYLDGRKI